MDRCNIGIGRFYDVSRLSRRQYAEFELVPGLLGKYYVEKSYQSKEMLGVYFAKVNSTPVRFELTHTLYTALAGQRLNHSAKVPFGV